MAPALPRSATDAVPGSVLIGVQPGGYASAPVVLRATFQPGGGGAGCNQENARDAGPWLEWRPAPTPTANAAATKPIATADCSRHRLARHLATTIAVVRPAAVVAVAITAAVLCNAGVRRRLGRGRHRRRRRGGRRRGRRRRGRGRRGRRR